MGKRIASAGAATIALIGSLLVTGAAPTSSSGCADPGAAAASYQQANSLGAADSVYVVCAGDSLTVSGVRADGTAVAPVSVSPPSATRSNESAAPAASSGVGGGGADCDILTVYRTECDFSFTYQKYKGTTLQWTRGVTGFARVDLQHSSHKVYMRLTSKNGFAINASGSMVLQRMQGLTPPTFENSKSFNFTNGGTQTYGTVYVSRTTTDTGKYSIIFGVTRIFDKQAGANIPIIIDPTPPRFQCYSAPLKNCDFPNGQEAGIF